MGTVVVEMVCKYWEYGYLFYIPNTTLNYCNKNTILSEGIVLGVAKVT